MGLHFMGDVPFRHVYIHALVRDERGQKMSKSKGNVIDPLELIDEYGCDALRFTLAAMAAQGRDIKLAVGRVEGYRNFSTKLLNAARYCQMNECVAQPGFDPKSVKLTVNRWIVGEVAKTAARVAEAIEAYRFNDAAGALYQFTWGTFCDWYLEFTKPILNGDDADAKAETRAATGWVLEEILQLLHPFMPFITEELWEKLGTGRESGLIRASWPEFGPDVVEPSAQAEMDWVVRLISTVRGVRSEMNVPAGAQIPLLLKDASAETARRLEAYRDIIVWMARLSSADITGELAPKGAVQAVVDEATVVLPLADVIDLDQERARLSKEIDKLTGEITKIDQKLNNANFVSRAPEEVIEEQRDRRTTAEAAKQKLLEALARLTST
jgi:valyl-tRNA synthetase